MKYYLELWSLPSRFSKSLRDAMALREFDITYLAYAAKISKYRIRKMISEDLERMPDIYKVMRLANALSVSIDYLIGAKCYKSDNELPVSAEFLPDAFGSENSIYEEMFYLLSTGYFIYVCETIPEILKTASVLESELGCRELAGDYYARMKAIGDAAERRENNGIVIMDSCAIEQLISGTGRYDSLKERQIEEQLRILNDFFANQAPTVNSAVIDYRTHGLSQMFLSTPSRVVSRLGDGYISAESLELYRHLRRKALLACREAPSFSGHVKQVAPKGQSALKAKLRV